MSIPKKPEKLFISFVIPLYNNEKYIEKTLESIIRQGTPDEIELIIVDDGSTDNSVKKVEYFKQNNKEYNVYIIRQKNHGAVVSTNNGIRRAKGKIICLVDSDAVLEDDWKQKIIDEFIDPEVGAVAGYIETANPKNFWAKMAGYDLEYRYDKIRNKEIDHISTCNTAYRKVALMSVGCFDPQFRYGYDNDMSYRLRDRGFKLFLQKDARCRHYWKEGMIQYLKQQYYVGLGRLQIIAKHPSKGKGDTVSSIKMFANIPITLLFLITIPFIALNEMRIIPLTLLFTILGASALETNYLIKKKKDLTLLFMPIVHLLRNIAWVAAVIIWTSKQLLQMFSSHKVDITNGRGT